jgi:DNA modification methylase
VLDPFCGSGSTLAAALLCGRRALGIELDEKNQGIAESRIARLTNSPANRWIECAV